MNRRFQFDNDWSETFALRPASAMVISPALIDNTSRIIVLRWYRRWRGISNVWTRSTYDLSRNHYSGRPHDTVSGTIGGARDNSH